MILKYPWNMYISQHQTWVIQSTPKWWTPIIKYVLKTTTLVMSCVNQHALNFKHRCCIWGLLEVPQTLTASAYSFLVESHGQGTIFWSTASRAKFLTETQVTTGAKSVREIGQAISYGDFVFFSKACGGAFFGGTRGEAAASSVRLLS